MADLFETAAPVAASLTGLRPYQTKGVNDLRRSIASGHRSPCLVLPTGAGKTILARDLIQSAVAKGKQVLFLAPRRELIFQCAEKLTRAGVNHSILMAGEPMNRFAPVQVASVPTLHARAVRSKRMDCPDAALVVIDESHLALGSMTLEVLAQYPNAVKVGLTATPCRKDGRGLGEVFDDLVLGPSVAELTALGHLVPARYFVPSRPDLKGIKIQAGDYNQKQLGDRMDNKTLIGDVLTNWLRIASDRKTVIFTVNVAHSLHIEQVFRDAGISIAHLDADTPNEERKEVLRKLRDGEIRVVTNCQILGLGWDEPSISACVLACPTKSLVKYLQAAGRVLRPSAGKTDCIILDHGGCVEEFGRVDDPHDWSLDGNTTVRERDAKKKDKKAPKDIVCEKCSNVFRSSNVCPACGWVMPTHKADAMLTIDDDLAELKGPARLNRQWTPEMKKRFYGELKWYGQKHGYSEGWAANQSRERLGVWPNAYRDAQPVEPCAETLAWIKHKQIKFYKSKAKQQASA